MEVIIVGAGLGGLTAAIALAKNGHRVKVIERKDQLWTVGGAINLTTGASTIINSLGLEDKLASISDHTELAIQRDLLTGTIFRSIPISRSGGAASRTTVRFSLMNMLFEEASHLGVVTKFSSTVTDLAETSSGASATLQDGTIEQAELIIAADGVRSRMRPKILSSAVSDATELDPIHSNRTYYVMKFEPDEVQQLRQCKELFAPHTLNFWAGLDDRYTISLYNPHSDLLSAVYCLREPINMETLFDESGDVKYVRDKFVGKCHPELEQALSVSRTCERWQLSQMPNLPTWRSPNGRMLVLGDAAHAMHPTAGQGYSSTVEEIAVLAYLLQTFPSDPAKATQTWEDFCKPRSERLKNYANFLSRQYEGEAEALQQAKRGNERDAEMQKEFGPELDGLKGDMMAEYGGPEWRAWLGRHDVLMDVKSFVEKKGPNGVAVA